MVILTSGGGAQAACERLTNAMTLAQDSFTSGARPDVVRLNELNVMLGDLRNDTILSILQNTGRGQDFSELRNFLTLLTFITQNVSPSEVKLNDSFASDMAQAALIVRSACILPDGSMRPDPPVRELSMSSSGIAKDRVIGSQLKTPSPSTERMSDHRGNLGVLGMVIIGFFAIGIFAICLHFGIIAARVIYRGRKTCEIPASLNFMGNSAPGRITMIGIYGCIFVPPEGEDAKEHDFKILTEGTYCQIQLHGNMLSARVMRDTKDKCHLWLSEPMTRAALNKALRHSIAPAQYDFSVLRAIHLRGGTFGMSTLPHN